MKNWPPAPKGTFYYICDQFEQESDPFSKEWDYTEEIVDGKKRYRWYKHALNSVHELIECDRWFDISPHNFEEFNYLFEGVQWVTKNDPRSLEYIMSELTPTVNQIVKDKLIEILKDFEYFDACAIIKEHLKSKPNDPVQAYEQKRKRVLKKIEPYAKTIEDKSSLLQSLRLSSYDKMQSKEQHLVEAFSVLLNLDRDGGLKKLQENIDDLDWLYKNDQDLLAHLFSDELCLETKDLFLKPFIILEEYELLTFFKTKIPVFQTDFPYYEIPPYIKGNHGLLSFSDDWEDWDDDD